MNYIKTYEIHKSTNLIRYISRNDINDIMTEILDNFGSTSVAKEDIYKSKSRNLDLEKRVVIATYCLDIPNNKMEHFNTCLKQAKWRFHSMIDASHKCDLLKLNNGENSYKLSIVFDDCSLEPSN